MHVITMYRQCFFYQANMENNVVTVKKSFSGVNMRKNILPKFL